MGNGKASNSAGRIAKTVLFEGFKWGRVLAAKGIYNSCFPRHEKRNLSAVYGEFDYSRVEEKLNRIPFNFRSGKIKLQGYYFPCEGAKRMVVVCHGMHAGADDYIPFIMYFVNNGYAVFAYDCRGTYASEGDSTVGGHLLGGTTAEMPLEVRLAGDDAHGPAGVPFQQKAQLLIKLFTVYEFILFTQKIYNLRLLCGETGYFTV